MSKEEDRKFFDTFMIVLGALVAFTVVVYLLANAIGDRTQGRYVAENPLKAQLVEQRIEPVGQVAIEGQAPPALPAPVSVAAAAMASRQPAVAATPASAPVMAAAPAAAADVDGKAVYESACFACHMAGVAGAPKFGDPEVWAPRIARGKDTLYANSINGYQGEAGIMPAKGGRADLSDAQVRAAVDYMVAAAQ